MIPPTVETVMRALDAIAPQHLCIEDDPRGLQIGHPADMVYRLAVCLDITPAVVAQAIRRGDKMIVAHHPLIFHPLTRILSREPHPDGVIESCIRADIAVACAHTNWDVAPGGVNDVLARLLDLRDARPLQITYREPVVHLAVFVPEASREAVFAAMTAAGAGTHGNSRYDRCGFWSAGMGTFRPLEGASPFIGTIGNDEAVAEIRLEMIAPEAKLPAIVAAMKAAHPYEEVAYSAFPLANTGAEYGIGRIGTLPETISAADLLERVKSALSFDAVRMVGPADRPVRKVAVGGGACAFLVRDAIRLGADALITSDVRHHEFVDAESRGFLLLDAGHAQTETPGARELARLLQLALPDTLVTFLSAQGERSWESDRRRGKRVKRQR